MNLLTAYRFNRHNAAGRTYPRTAGPNPAIEALTAARADMMTYRNAKTHLESCAAIRDARRDELNAAKESAQSVTAAAEALDEAERFYRSAIKTVAKAKRYDPAGPSRVCYQNESRLAYVERPESFGLRYVGRVMPDAGRDIWDKRESCGWYTDPYGDVFHDDSGLCFGVVYQLPARNGRARFIAGYQFGGIDEGPTLDLGNVYESASAENCSYEGAQGHEDAHDTARAADSMAQRAAERERDYQTAWQLGNVYRNAVEEVEEARAAALILFKERRLAMESIADNVPAVCEAIRSTIKSYTRTIADARETMRKALQGDAAGLCLYMDADARSAFCDAAGLNEWPE